MSTSTPLRKITETSLSQYVLGFLNRILSSEKLLKKAQKIHHDEQNQALDYIYEEILQQLGETDHSVVFKYQQVDQSKEEGAPVEPTLLQELIFRAIDVENGTVISGIMEIFHDRFVEKTNLRSTDSVRDACAHFNSCLKGKYELHVKRNPSSETLPRATLCFLLMVS